MTVVLAGNDKVPNLIGYCGDIFVTEGVDSYRLQADAESWDLFTSLPPWPTRVRIAVSILEFVEDIQDLFLGNLLLCSLSDASIGLVSEEASFYNLEWLASETQIREHLKYHPCLSSEDCTYGPNCATQCGPMGMCISNTTRINLPQTCSILETFITRGAPRTFYPKLKGLVDRCISMDPARKDIFMEHSLVLNDLKNSLWYEIHLLWVSAKFPRRIATTNLGVCSTNECRAVSLVYPSAIALIILVIRSLPFWFIFDLY